MLRLSDYLDPALIKVPLASRAKLDVITELVDLLCANGRATDRQRLLDAVLARERQRTTAVGRGLAIPHAKCDACDRLVIAIGRTVEPLEFDAIDGKPVHLVVLMTSPLEQASVQIQMLAKLSRLVTNEVALRAILDANSADALRRAIVEHETV
ncbi:MAG: PTS sugar transporter subunit IIA [Phycisphaerae bacterium]|nr:PTS sugar transporter subunit IIA [Phycisphaerae bacterium]